MTGRLRAITLQLPLVARSPSEGRAVVAECCSVDLVTRIRATQCRCEYVRTISVHTIDHNIFYVKIASHSRNEMNEDARPKMRVIVRYVMRRDDGGESAMLHYATDDDDATPVILIPR